MNFILTENNQIIIGPKLWNKRAFENILEDDLEITTTLPQTNDSFLSISDTVKFYPVIIVEPANFNPRIHQYAGPFYVFDTTSAIGTYTIVDKTITEVNSNLKNIVATNRYNNEISGTTITIQGLIVTLDTTRGLRDAYIQQYALMSDIDTIHWKFLEGWLTLTKSDLDTIVRTISSFVQAQFAWEAIKHLEIDACATLDQLDKIILTQQ